MKALHKLVSFIRARGWLFIMAGILLIIGGMRLAITERNCEALPFSDDWFHLNWLRSLITDYPDTGYPFRYHNEHYVAAAHGLTWLTWKLNGIWDVRLETLGYTIAYTAYAALTMWFFLKMTSGRGKVALCVLSLAFLAMPVSGYRAAWGFVSCVTFAMIFGVSCIYFGITTGARYWRAVLAVCCGILSTMSIAGCGVIICAAVAGIVILRFVRTRQWTGALLVLAAGLIAVAAVALVTKPARHDGPTQLTIGILIKAFTSSLAWPSVFARPAALINLLPGLLLLIAWWRDARMRTAPVELILTVYAFLTLQALGIAIFRGENNNMAMPSNRYYDMLQMTPFAAAAACVVLLQAYPLRRSPRVAGGLLMITLAGGFCIHFFYRMWPYISRENGETIAAVQVNWIRHVLENGWQEPAVMVDVESNETDVAMAREVPVLKSWVQSKGEDPILPGTMITGHPLMPQGESAFVRDGYMNKYMPRPGYRYYGSYGQARSTGIGTFVSEPFTARAQYFTIDVIVPKKARFAFYRISDCELNVVDAESGEKISVLPKLARSLPSIFRDREVAVIPVTAGRRYRLEASDQSQTEWFAFSEPADAGRMAPVLFGLTASGKLFAFLGILLAATGIYSLMTKPAPGTEPH
jgi:hypothetical protein